MRTNLLSAVAAVALVSIANVAPASAAVFPVGTTTPGVGSFQAAPGPNGTFNGAINRIGLGEGTFSDTFTFTLPAAGFGSGSVISSNVGGVTGLTFSSVTFNGTSLTINSNGDLTFAGVNNVQIFANQLNTLVVSGTSAGGASYGGNLTFVPGAVPETATWMMMLAGFGMMGAGLRYRRRSANVKFA